VKLFKKMANAIYV